MIIIIIVVVKITQSTWFPHLIQKKWKRSREDRTSQNSKGSDHYLSPEGGGEVVDHMEDQMIHGEREGNQSSPMEYKVQYKGGL